MGMLVALLDHANVVGQKALVDGDPRDIEHVRARHSAHAVNAIEERSDRAIHDTGAALQLGLGQGIWADEQTALGDVDRDTDDLFSARSDD